MIVVGFYVPNEGIIVSGVALMLFTIIIGWAGFGCLFTVTERTIEGVGYVLHDKNAIHISNGTEIIYTFTDITMYNRLQDKSEIKIIGTYGFNMYGGVISGTNWTIPKQ